MHSSVLLFISAHEAFAHELFFMKQRALQLFLQIYYSFVHATVFFCFFFLLCGLFSAAKPASGKRDYPQTIDTLAFIQDMHEKGFAA